MAQIKSFKLKINSKIEPVSGDTEYSDTECAAKVAFMSSGSVIISYEEETEGGRLLSDIRIMGSEVSVSRRGAISSVLHFREGEAYKTVYSVPPMTFDMEIKTRRIRNGVSEAGGVLLLVYDMTVGGDARRHTMRIELL